MRMGSILEGKGTSLLIAGKTLSLKKQATVDDPTLNVQA